MNKRGEDKTFSIFWFFMIFLVAAAIIYMVFAFYSRPYDIRDLEANILVNNAADCISKEGVLNSDLFLNERFSEEFKTNFLKSCNFNFETIDFTDNLQYYVGVDFFNLSEMINPIFFIEAGNLNLVTSCELENEDYEKLSRCVTRRFYSTYGGKQYLIEIKGVVRKTEKNVK